MFKILFNIIINLLATLIQIVCLPLNTIMANALPDLTTKISNIVSSFTGIFNTLSWPISVLPPIVLETLLFIFTIEVAKHTIFTSTHVLIKVWNLFQKIKFW